MEKRTHLKPYLEDYLLLAELGFVAANQSDEPSATQLFKAAKMLDPEATLPQLGAGYLHLLKLELKDANEHFDQVLEKEPGNQFVQALKAFSYTLYGKAETVNKGVTTLETLIKEAKEAQVKELCKSALKFYKECIYIEKGPAA